MPTYLSKENRSKHATAAIKEYPLPYDPDTIVRVKQQSIARMNRYTEAVQAGGGKAKKDTFALISESIVDETDDRVWEATEVELLHDSNCQLVTALVRMIGACNGGNDQEIEEMLGNLGETK